MVYAFISDTHSNLEAVDAVIADIEARGISEIFCLGDVVGYGPNPIEVIAVMKKRKIKCIKGNHDYFASEGFGKHKIGRTARLAMNWTRKQLGPREVNFLKKLPYNRRLDGGKVILTHGDLTKPKEFRYIQLQGDLMANFDLLKPGQQLFAGHTHVPGFFYRGKIKGEESLSMDPFDADSISCNFRKKDRFIVHVGSVGQPRDRDPRACWVEVSEKRAKMHRVKYDIGQVARKLTSSSMNSEVAERLGERLYHGR